MLVDELTKAKQREQLLDWETNERRLASEPKLNVPKRSLSAAQFECWNRFSTWGEGESVRKIPAKPRDCRGIHSRDGGNRRSTKQIVSVVNAADVVHQFHGLSSPLHTQIVRAALDTLLKAEPPRSWSKDEKAEWALLPPSIRDTIARRERERDTALRRLQNKTSEGVGVRVELRKFLGRQRRKPEKNSVTTKRTTFE